MSGPGCAAGSTRTATGCGSCATSPLPPMSGTERGRDASDALPGATPGRRPRMAGRPRRGGSIPSSASSSRPGVASRTRRCGRSRPATADCAACSQAPALALVLALLAGTLAVSQRNRASTARDRAAAAADAETVGRLVAQSRVAQDTKLDLALLLALEANRRADSPETRGALQSALRQQPRAPGVPVGQRRRGTSRCRSPRPASSPPEQGRERSTCGRTPTGGLIGTLAVGSGPVVVAFSPDGSTLAALSDDDHTLTLVGRGRPHEDRPAADDECRHRPSSHLCLQRRRSPAVGGAGLGRDRHVGRRQRRGDRPADGERGRRRVPCRRLQPRRAVAGRWGCSPARSRCTTPAHDSPPSPRWRRVHARRANSLAFDRHGARLASSGPNADVVVWDLTTGRLVPSASAGLDGDGVAFSPRDDMLAAGSTELDLRDLAIPDDPVASVPTQGGVAVSIAYSPDGTYVAAANTNGSISLVDVAGQAQARAGHSPPSSRLRSSALTATCSPHPPRTDR